eukprot:UN06526
MAYTEAIELDATDHTFYSNRSACYQGMEEYENSLKDAEKVIELKPDFAKGYSRKGLALLKLKKFDEAVETYKAGVKKFPTDQNMTKSLEAAESQKAAAAAPPPRSLIPPEGFMKAMADPEIKGWYDNDPAFKLKVQMLQNPATGMSQNILQSMFTDKKLMKFFSVATGVNLGGMPDMPGGPGGPMGQEKEDVQMKEPTPPPVKELSKEEKELQEKTEKADSLKEEGTAAYKKKDFAKALELYTKASEVFPEAPVYVLNCASALMMQNKLDESEKNG